MPQVLLDYLRVYAVNRRVQVNSIQPKPPLHVTHWSHAAKTTW
jgi:hypothetical protein